MTSVKGSVENFSEQYYVWETTQLRHPFNEM